LRPRSCSLMPLLLFFLHPTPTPQIYTLSLHDALPISGRGSAARRSSSSRGSPRRGRRAGSRPPRRTCRGVPRRRRLPRPAAGTRSEEHTSELQSRFDLVCRLLLEKKKKTTTTYQISIC